MRLLTAFLMATSLHTIFADEVLFNSIQRGAEDATIGEWVSRDVWMSDRISNVSDPAYPGTASVYRFLVEPGDKVGGWTGERAEFSGMRIGKEVIWDNENSGTQFFAFSVYIPAGWKSPEIDTANDVWGVLLQLHGPLSFLSSPPVSLNLTDHFTVSVRGGNSDVLGDWHGKTHELEDGGSIRFDQWDDFVLMVTFARDDKGAVRLWRRTNGKHVKVFELEGAPTLVFKPSVEAKMPNASQRMMAGAHYWKQGFYRSASPHVTTILYQTGLVRASTFEAATSAAFGKKDDADGRK